MGNCCDCYHAKECEYFDEYSNYVDDCFEDAQKIEKLKKNAERYRWHDLIRDKDDLPADGETVEVLYEYYHFKAEAVLPEYGHARYYHGSKFWGGDASNGSQLKVLAWRYIEPVEEEADA